MRPAKTDCLTNSWGIRAGPAFFQYFAEQALLMAQQPDPDRGFDAGAGGTVQAARNLHLCSRNADTGDRVVRQRRQALVANVWIAPSFLDAFGSHFLLPFEVDGRQHPVLCVLSL